jgi:hypothetical protein
MFKTLLFTVLASLLIACSQDNRVDIKMSDVDKAFAEVEPRIVLEKKGIKLIEANDFPLFSDTKLSMESDSTLFQFGPNKIELILENYGLGGSTTDQNEKNTRLNSTGQFIYLIKDQTKIKKVSNINFDFDLKRGLNSFFVIPSRSYEMSIKNDNSWLAFELEVTDTKKRAKYRSISEPAVFICSPSGRYNEGISEKVLFDFFLANTTISPEGNKVKLSIDNKTSFIIDNWAPYYIEGLNNGKHFFKAELLDKDGKTLPGKYSSVGPVYFSLQSITY